MKITRCFLLIVFVFCECELFGYDQDVHRKITENAADSALSFSPTYKSFFDVTAPGINPSQARVALSDGSFNEDLRDKDAGGARSLNHFYDPIHKIALSDRGWPWSPAMLGRNSFDWASISNEPGVDVGWPVSNTGTYNTWSWQNARYYEWLGLTATNQITRQTNLANMFRSIGQVVHLLEDTSQPQHVRNEQHLDNIGLDLRSRSAIEDYYKKTSTQLPARYVGLEKRRLYSAKRFLGSG